MTKCKHIETILHELTFFFCGGNNEYAYGTDLSGYV
jgi:hypothetical protein